VSLSESFECSEQLQSHKNRSKYEYCVVFDPSKQSGKVQGTGERSGFFSEEVGDRGNNFVKPLQRNYVRCIIQIPKNTCDVTRRCRSRLTPLPNNADE